MRWWPARKKKEPTPLEVELEAQKRVALYTGDVVAAGDEQWISFFDLHATKVVEMLFHDAPLGTVTPSQAMVAVMGRVIRMSAMEIEAFGKHFAAESISYPGNSPGQVAWRCAALMIRGEKHVREATTEREKFLAKALFNSMALLLLRPGEPPALPKSP